MTLRWTGKNGKLTIENLRNYPSDVVERLRGLLTTGANARPDPRRKAFYDVQDGARVFFIHISPVSGNVMLLATWCEEAAAATAQVHTGRAFASQFAA